MTNNRLWLFTLLAGVGAALWGGAEIWVGRHLEGLATNETVEHDFLAKMLHVHDLKEAAFKAQEHKRVGTLFGVIGVLVTLLSAGRGRR